MADTNKILNCPACGKQMEKIFIEKNGINVDICTNGCGGMLFDNRELEKFDESHENADEIFEAIKGKEFNKVDESVVRNCPVCNTPMVKMGARGGIQIDVCNVCGAKFLDNGELEIIKNAIEQDEQFNAKFDVKYKDLNEENRKEVLGTLGMFVNKYFRTSSLRKESENLTKKILGNQKNNI